MPLFPRDRLPLRPPSRQESVSQREKVQRSLDSHADGARGTRRWSKAASRLSRTVVSCLAAGCIALAAASAGAAENLVFVTWDGFRWQEFFGGAEERLINKESGGVPNVAELRAQFWRESPEARREALLPFMWGTVVKQGQVFGDHARQAPVRVTNGKKFSYPGYSEMFVGFADERIKSNDKILNPNINVLEYLNRRPAFAGQVAAFATWDVLEYILNQPRSGMLVQSGWSLLVDEPLTMRQQQVNDMVRELPRLWRNNSFDFLTQQAALEHLRKHRPRVLYIGLGETDEWAHARRYDLYLEAAHRADRYLHELWQLLESLPEYKGQTTLVVTTDHGRGVTPRDWISHGATIAEAEYIWIAALGPDVASLGVRENIACTQSQIAATLAALVGEDFSRVAPQVASPLNLTAPVVGGADSNQPGTNHD